MKSFFKFNRAKSNKRIIDSCHSFFYKKTKIFISYKYFSHRLSKNIPAAIQNSPIIVSGLFIGDLVRFVIIITSLLFNDVCSIGCKIKNYKHFRANYDFKFTGSIANVWFGIIPCIF